MTAEPLKVLELFAGIGGIGRGLEQTGGFKVIGSVEIDEFCNQVRRRWWPDVPQWGDIREFPPPGYDGRPDVICGGSPCQDLSCAGKRAGLAGERSGLFHEMLRIVGELQPRWVIWENVRAAFSSNGGRDFLTILHAFHDAGYDAEWCCLRASDFGYPHGRARVFLVAHRRGAQQERAAGKRSASWEGAGRRGAELADKSVKGLEGATRARIQGRGNRPSSGGSELADGPRALRQRPAPGEQGQPAQQGEGIPHAPPGPNETERWAEILERWPWLAPAIPSTPPLEDFRRLADGLSARLGGHRQAWRIFARMYRLANAERAQALKALGNAVVGACARWIGERILKADHFPDDGNMGETKQGAVK